MNDERMVTGLLGMMSVLSIDPDAMLGEREGELLPRYTSCIRRIREIMLESGRDEDDVLAVMAGFPYSTTILEECRAIEEVRAAIGRGEVEHLPAEEALARLSSDMEDM